MSTQTMPTTLDMSGVYAKGYGTIPKAIFFDSTLSIGSKTLYAYLCAISGQEKEVTISREKILYDLGICKDTYYSYFNPLLAGGYTEVYKSSGMYSKNTYKINDASKNSDEPARAGYGLIPRSVMIDPNLDIKSKAIYAYSCAFAGTTHKSYQKKSVMNAHLGINDKTASKAIKEITEANYMFVEQSRQDARYGVNYYNIIVNFQDKSVMPENENMVHAEPECITQIQPESVAPVQQDINQASQSNSQTEPEQNAQAQFGGNPHLHPATKKQDTGLRHAGAQSTNLPYTKKQSTKIQSTKKQDTYPSNNIIINNSSNINHFNHSSSKISAGNICQEENDPANSVCVLQSEPINANKNIYDHEKQYTYTDSYEIDYDQMYQNGPPPAAKPKKPLSPDGSNLKFDALFNCVINDLSRENPGFKDWIHKLTYAQREYLPENFKIVIRERIRNTYIHDVPAYMRKAIHQWLLSQFKLEEYDVGPSSMPYKEGKASYDISELDKLLG